MGSHGVLESSRLLACFTPRLPLANKSRVATCNAGAMPSSAGTGRIVNRVRLSREQQPSGYPTELECSMTLQDGRTVFVRPIVPADKSALRDAVAHADPQTLRARFLGGRPPTDDRALDHLTVVDYVHRLALVAFDQDRHGVAIARFEGSMGRDVAEVAIVVQPGWRRVGLATGLLRLLAAAAIDRGIAAFTATYYADNVDVRSLVRSSGLPFREATTDELADVVIELDTQAIAHPSRDTSGPVDDSLPPPADV